jgi:3',5'-cyclic AMP phosphodiesterase CpdA
MAMRIAHCSDLHLLSLEGARALDFANKRWIGGLNLLTNRGRDYLSTVFEAMIADFNASDIAHVVCTGDITNLALKQEFHFARDHFDRIELGAGEVTVIPGNHDAYVARGGNYFLETFADYYRPDDEWQSEYTWPLVRIRGHVAVIGVSTSLQTPWFTAYGRVGAGQLERLRAVLMDERLAGKLRLVAIHHPPAGPAARNLVRGLRDWKAFAQVIAEAGAELVIHGHEHRDLRNALPGPGNTMIDVLGVQSGTYASRRHERIARYRIFEVMSTPGERARVIQHRLRMWSADQGKFVDDPQGPATEEVPEAAPVSA